MNKSEKKKLNTKMSYNMFFSLHSLNYIHIFFILYLSISLSFRGIFRLFEKIHTHNHIQSLTHPFIHSFIHSLTTHHCLNTVFAVVVVYLFVGFIFSFAGEKEVHSKWTFTKQRRENKKRNPIANASAILIWIEHSPQFVP